MGEDGRRLSLRSFREIPPKVRLLILLTFPSLIGIGYYIIVISSYLPKLGISPSYVGLILATFGASAILSSIPLGVRADRKGRKSTIIFALALAPFVFVVYGLTTNVWIILAVSAVGGVIEAGFLTCWNAMIADMTTLEQRNPAFSLSFIVNNVAFGIGAVMPFIFPLFEDAFGWSTHALHSGTFLVFAGLSIVSPIAIYRLLKDVQEVKRPDRRRLRDSESIGIILKFSTISGVFGLGAGFIIPLIPTLLFLEFNVPDTYSGPLLAAGAILMASTAAISTGLARRYGVVNTIVWTQASSTVFMFVLAFAPNALTLGGLYLVRTALMNMAAPVQDSYLMSVISERDRGLASAIMGITWRLPNSATTVIGGVLLANGMFHLPFYIATVTYVAAIILFYYFFRNLRPGTKPAPRN